MTQKIVYAALLLVCGIMYILWRGELLPTNYVRFLGYWGLHGFAAAGLFICYRLLMCRLTTLALRQYIFLGTFAWTVGTVIECTQLFTGGRVFDWLDIGSNTVGIMIVVPLVFLTDRAQERKSSAIYQV